MEEAKEMKYHYTREELDMEKVQWTSTCGGESEPYLHKFYYSKPKEHYKKDGKEYWVYED